MAPRSTTTLKKVHVPDLIVHGGRPLSGRITPSANKNAVLPILDRKSVV